MSTDIGHLVMFGVKVGFSEVFEVIDVETYNCEHKEKIHAYCPTCGRRAKSVEKEAVPKIQLNEKWHDNNLRKKPVLDDKYFMYLDVDNIESNPDVYIGVTFEMLYANRGNCDSSTVTVAEMATDYLKCEDMVKLLSSLGIDVSIDDCKLHIVWFSY